MTTPTSVSTAGTTPPPDPRPKVGGDFKLSAWTGRKTNVAWDKTENTHPAPPFCYRFNDAFKDLKTYPYLTTCASQKFKRVDLGYSLPAFARDAAAHMVRGGMDSVFYFVNPTDNTDRLSIFNFHSRFTASEVTRQVKENHSNNTYDKYDTDNLDMSYVWLMDALDDTLKIAIRPQLVPNMSGPELFMTIVSEVQSDSIRSLRKKERNLEQLTLTSYPAENVKLLNNQILDTCDELERAGCLPQDIILTVVEKYTDAKSEEFRIHFLNRRSHVEDHLKVIAGKDASTIAAMPNCITYRTLCNESNEKYQMLLDHEKWAPANTDKGAAPLAFMTQADVEGLLKQKLDGNNTGKGTTVMCFNCGKKGHYVNNLTNPTSIALVATGASREWMKIQPTAGSPDTKEVNGRTWHWCGGCNRWLTTHGAASHKNKVKEGESPPEP